MSGWTLALLICLVVVLGTVGGAATRYERYGPDRERGPAGALAVISLTLAVTIAVVAFGVATLQTDGLAWRLLGLSCAAGVFGGLVAARGVDHYLVLRSPRGAVRAVGADGRSMGRSVRYLLGLVPWATVAAALSGTADARQRSDERTGR